jgi:predicted transporter
MSLAGSITSSVKGIFSVIFKIGYWVILLALIIGIGIFVYRQFSKIKEEKNLNKFCIDNNITRDDLDIILESDKKDD